MEDNTKEDRITFRIPEEYGRRLRSVAANEERSVGAQIRLFIREGLEREEHPQREMAEAA